MPDDTDPDSLEAYIVKALHDMGQRLTKVESGAWKQVGIAVVAAASHVGLEVFKAFHSVPDAPQAAAALAATAIAATVAAASGTP